MFPSILTGKVAQAGGVLSHGVRLWLGFALALRTALEQRFGRRRGSVLAHGPQEGWSPVMGQRGVWPRFVKGFLRKSLTCAPVWLVPNTGHWYLLLAGTGLAAVGGVSLFSCPVSSSFLLQPPKPFLASSLRSPACSGRKWPGLIFLPPWAGHRDVFGPHSGITGFRWPQGPTGSSSHHASPLRYGRSKPRSPSAHRASPSQLPQVPVRSPPLPPFGRASGCCPRSAPALGPCT